MMLFDENGFLTPFEPIRTDLETVKETFATNTHRENLFEEYLVFLRTLRELDLSNFFQWINGSFVTQKTFPKDIDVVTFLNYQNLPFIEEKLSPNLFKSNTLDCYFVIIYPEEHSLHNLYNMDRAEWNFLFSTTRRNRKTGKMLKKGFVQLNF
ncbi:MAG: hypothetical protein Q7T20_19140 [Saprospiraceae bacterium]|nr:hypothetical protein [Saprospiraceae bacterium]